MFRWGLGWLRKQKAYRKSTDRVDSPLVQVGVTHDGGSGGKELLAIAEGDNEDSAIDKRV